MICIIAGNYEEARIFARAQLLANNEWFYPTGMNDLMQRRNFHVLVIGTAGQNVPPYYFEKVLAVAQTRGRIDRV